MIMQLETLLVRCIAAGASDLHLATGEPPVLRIDGDLVREPGPALSAGDLRGLLDLHGQDGRDFTLSLPGQARFRIHASERHDGPGAALRHLPWQVPDLATLGLPERLGELACAREGLILFCGASGSGKSSALAAMLQHVNRRLPVHILTLEDPVEFVHQSACALISQRLPEPGRNWLEEALREDPDILMLGELRTAGSMRMALTAAQTGHLVMSTLHSRTAAGAIERILDVLGHRDARRIQAELAETLTAVVALKLVKRQGGGRVPVLEILLATHAVRNVIREGRTAQLPGLIQTGMAEGMISFAASHAALQATGQVSSSA